VKWSRITGVTLIGDAAHLMSPFAGEGANLAMFDGAELAQAIINHGNDHEAALSAYEAALFPRSRDIARLSDDNLSLFFGDGTPHSVAEMFRTLVPPGP
jgi:2-polyprenyl-6-methoxyphenol hydroxylase-like FAD-dependent oxidoreductase